MKKKLIFLLIISIIVPISTFAKVKNVILLIGDGMGLNHIHAAKVASESSLQIERAHYIGIIETYSANSYITDSGAGGTALACGIKTNNGMIGMNADSVAVPSILHIAKANKLATGIVATSSITHATPASFVAHQVSRKMEEEIAKDILHSDVDIFIGGGRKFFNERDDEKNLLDSLTAKGYGVYASLQDASLSTSSKKGVLLANHAMPSKLEGRGNMLPEATQLALDVLSKNKKGFFLMIEGSQIDWAGHGNNIEGIIAETLDFDKAVGIAMDFADKNKGTLVIVTADHETGGLQILGKDNQTNELHAIFTSNDHTPVPVPLFAYGQDADKFSNFMNNTDIKQLLIEVYKFKK
jgi:alkaline phosphatase